MGWAILFLAALAGGFALYDFWDGYHRTRSVVAGLASVGLGLLRFFFDGAWAFPEEKSKSDRVVI